MLKQSSDFSQTTTANCSHISFGTQHCLISYFEVWRCERRLMNPVICKILKKNINWFFSIDVS